MHIERVQHTWDSIKIEQSLQCLEVGDLCLLLGNVSLSLLKDKTYQNIFGQIDKLFHYTPTKCSVLKELYYMLAKGKRVSLQRYTYVLIIALVNNYLY